MTIAGAQQQRGGSAGVARSREQRFRLHRAGICNVWQYDDQEFRLAEGRMLLRGANGAGKSKTLEILLPFVLDGDKARLTASGRHHTSLLWLMTDGYEGQARVGYVWVEFARPVGDGTDETFTCGVGIRASASARTAGAWYFTTRQRVGDDLHLEDDAGPLSRPRLAEEIGSEGQVFEQPHAYKEHVGRALFGLSTPQYDEVLRLLYWLRQPQVGEDIDPKRLAGQLAQALPQLDERAVRSAGDTFDDLAAFGEQIERRQAAAESLAGLASAYTRYARGVAGSRGQAVVEALREERRRATELKSRRRRHTETRDHRDRAEQHLRSEQEASDSDHARVRELEASPEARDQRRLADLTERLREQKQAAGSAAERARNAEARHAAQRDRLADDAGSLADRVRGLARSARDLNLPLRECGTDAIITPSTVLEGGELTDTVQAERLTVALAGLDSALREAGSTVRQRQAAVLVVREALDRASDARRQCTHAEEQAARTESRWEASRERRLAAARHADDHVVLLWESLRQWAATEGAPPVVLPEELTEDMLSALPQWADEWAAARLDELRAGERAAALVRDRAADEVEDLTRQRATIASETDPAPPAPSLVRTRRPDGAPLWRLVDFADTVADDERARLEAALQEAGLLDAWVRPDGAVLDADDLDRVLPLGPALSVSTLCDVLTPACPDDADVSADVVTGVLRRVAHGIATETGAWVDGAGRWQLGPLQGRAHKARPQYIGATARAQERQRRLAEIDDALDAARNRRTTAADEASALAERVTALEGWVRAVPSSQPLLAAWARLEERTEIAERDERDNAAAQHEAQHARQLLAGARQRADRVAGQHELPAVADGLTAVEQRLRGLTDDLGGTQAHVPGLSRELSRWTRDETRLSEEAEVLDGLVQEATTAKKAAERSAVRLHELEQAVGSTVRDLQRRLDELRDSIDARTGQIEQLETQVRELGTALGREEEVVRQAEEHVVEHRQVRSAVLRRLAEIVEVVGLLDSAFGSLKEPAEPSATAHEPPERSVIAQAGTVEEAAPVPADVASAARFLAGLSDAGTGVDVNPVWRAYNEAANGPAADYEPRVVELGDLVAVVGRDEGSEAPIDALAQRVAVGVQQDREMLRERERRQFEQHLLGELGDAIRGCRVEADELVAAMNQLLSGVSTSQGIRVRLDWRLRDDVPADAAEAVRLLTQPVGALLPEERETLRDALHRLIEASRAERPELSYSEHLGEALDYRSWFAFRIRYSRPEGDGRWLDLHRRSPLSQGEQKVLCYLPLFAAAAAHFESLAGAAPHAPRLVLLDDAFPKIDVRTHPLLFGLLVQLDLDFVITSERLWGDHDTVPALAIYEALRDPSQRGIAQFEYRWDGRQLRAIG